MKKEIRLAFDYIFPTFALPNASMVEYGVMNYLISLNTNKYKDMSVFENNEDISAHKIFDNSLGHNPNSGTGTFFPANVYSKIVDIEFLSIYLEKNKNKKFLYPIRPNPNLNDFIGVNTGHGRRTNGAYFWKYISKEAIQLIKNRRGYIFIDYSMEPFIDYDTHLKFHESLKQSDIDKDSIYICVNSFNAKECYEKWFQPHERMYNVRNLPFCLDHSAWFYNDSILNNKNLCMKTTDFYSTKEKIRKNHFLMKMRNPRSHRLALIYKMLSEDLLKYGDWSFLADFANYDHITARTLLKDYELGDFDYYKIERLHKESPHFLQSEKGNTFNKINAWTDTQFIPHTDSYFEICFETFIHGEHKSLTEKILKPIINFQPFIFFAYPGALSLLRELGFRTFDGFIDESYDNETKESIRINKIYNEIKRLCSMTKEEIHNWYWSMEEILVHNHNHLRNYNQNKIFGGDLITELSNLINTSFFI